MLQFLGLECGGRNFKLQQIVDDTSGKPVRKTSPIEVWVVADVGNGVLYIPLSKLDFEINKTIVPAQLLRYYSDNTRSILQKTPTGTATLPNGAIFQRRF